MTKKITVVIPVYNVKEYVKEAVDSIISQIEYVHEVILVNDGSTDGSGELLEKLYSNMDFVKIIHKKNEGQGPARNLGTQMSTGDYIYYFDADDVCKPELLNKFHNLIFHDNDLELFCFSAESFLDQNYSKDNVNYESLLSKKAYLRNIVSDCKSGEDAFNILYSKKSFFAVPYLYIFKKSIVTNNNIKFRPIRYEDEEFTQQLFLYAGKTIISNEIYCMRRIRKGSVMQKKRNFVDLIGYFKTVETIQDLQKLDFIKTITRTNLGKRATKFIRNIIIIKASNNMKMSWNDKKLYIKNLSPFIRKDRNLLKLAITYSTEYKLRKLKQSLFK